MYTSHRRFWKRPGHTDLWWYRLNTGELLQEEWCKNLKIDINTFMTIVEELLPAITPSENSLRRDTISAEKKLAMCLYYLKDQGSYRMTANTFGVSRSKSGYLSAIIFLKSPYKIKLPNLLQNHNLQMLFEFYIRLSSQLMFQSYALPTSIVLLSPLYTSLFFSPGGLNSNEHSAIIINCLRLTFISIITRTQIYF